MDEDASKSSENNADSNTGSGKEDDGTKIRKRKERLEQNRISARESRKRKKNMIEELQRTVITLSREHKELSQRNEALKQQMMDLTQTNSSLATHNPHAAMLASAQMTSLPQMNHVPTQPQQQTAGANSNVVNANAQPLANNGATAQPQQQQQLPQGFPHFNAMFGGFMPGANFAMMPQQQAAWLTNPALFQQQMFMAQQVAQQQQQQQMMQHGTSNGSQSQNASAQVAASSANHANGETNIMHANINPPSGMQASSASHAEV